MPIKITTTVLAVWLRLVDRTPAERIKMAPVARVHDIAKCAALTKSIN